MHTISSSLQLSKQYQPELTDLWVLAHCSCRPWGRTQCHCDSACTPQTSHHCTSQVGTQQHKQELLHNQGHTLRQQQKQQEAATTVVSCLSAKCKRAHCSWHACYVGPAPAINVTLKHFMTSSALFGADGDDAVTAIGNDLLQLYRQWFSILLACVMKRACVTK